MDASVFVEFKFWLLICLSVLMPVFTFALRYRKAEATHLFVFMFGAVVTAVAGVDVYLLQTLAEASKAAPSLVDDAIFNSEISLSLYVISFLFGGIGVNFLSDAVTGHLPDAKARYDKLLVKMGWRSRRKSLRTPELRGLNVQLQKSASTNEDVVLPFTGPKILRRKVGALLECLEPGSRAPGIPLHELLSPGFVAAYTHFGAIDDMFEACGFSATSQEECGNLAGERWDAFVRSTTQFTGWESMLQSACRHWLALNLLADQSDRVRFGKSFASMRRHRFTIAQPDFPQGYDWLAPRPVTAAGTLATGRDNGVATAIVARIRALGGLSPVPRTVAPLLKFPDPRDSETQGRHTSAEPSPVGPVCKRHEVASGRAYG